MLNYSVNGRKEEMRLKHRRVFAIDLIRIEGDGEFSCPQCENAISPDDASEETYSIVEPKVNRHGLDKLIIRCNKCATRIHLTGFPLLQKLSGTDERLTLGKLP